MSTKLKMLITGEDEVPRGESVYAIPGTYSWTCPAGVTSVSVVVVGGGGGGSSTSVGGSGGGLAYKNNIAVTPGTNYTVVVGAGGRGVTNRQSYLPPGTSDDGGASYFKNVSTVRATGGRSGTIAGAFAAGDGGGNGGTSNQGGGGAAGYSGNGGNGSSGTTSTSGSGGGGSGGDNSNGGGGVGLFGQGSNGSTTSGYPGEGGSGGEDGHGAIPGSIGREFARNGGAFGGGAGCALSTYPGGSGGNGAVRIVWPGDTRQFPSTDVGTP